MTLKEREALKDSIIAKAKRDAEAAKAKEKKWPPGLGEHIREK